MRAVNLRPLALFCLTFFASCVLFCTETPWKLWLAAASLILSIFFTILYHKKERNLYLRTVALIALALFAALVFTFSFINKPMNEHMKHEGEHQISGKITSTQWSSSYSNGYTAEIYEIDGKPVDFNVSLTSTQLMKRGDTFTADAELSTVKYETSIRYYISYRIYLMADAANISYTGQSLDIGDRLYEINQRLSARLVNFMGVENGGFAASMFLGNRDYMGESFTNAVTKLGLAHVIALSGMHLTVICAMLSLVLSNFGAKASRLCAIPIVAFYIIITGFFTSIVRAGIMLICYNLITFTGRATDQPTNLGISAIAIILFDPSAVCDIGFQLSVIAMLGVFAALKLMGGQSIEYDTPRQKLIKAALLPFVMGVVSMGFTMIPVVLYFGYITPAAIVATVPFSFMGDVILWLSPFALALGGIWLLGDVICILCSIPCDAFINLALFLGKSNKITVRVSESPQIWLAILFSICFMVIFVLDSKKAQKITLAISLAFFAAFAGVSGYIAWNEYNSVRCETMKIASGDGFIVSYRDETIAVDISGGSQKMYRQITDQAEYMHIDEIDKLIIADPHATHAYQLHTITDRIRVKEIWMPDIPASKEIAETISRQNAIVYYSFGKQIHTEGFSITTYEDTYLERSSVPIIRFKVETDEDSLFYIGSACTEAGLTPENSDYLWIGGYGPKNKAEIDISSKHSYILISEKSAEFCSHNISIQSDSTLILDKP